MSSYFHFNSGKQRSKSGEDVSLSRSASKSVCQAGGGPLHWTSCLRRFFKHRQHGAKITVRTPIERQNPELVLAHLSMRKIL